MPREESKYHKLCQGGGGGGVGFIAHHFFRPAGSRFSIAIAFCGGIFTCVPLWHFECSNSKGVMVSWFFCVASSSRPATCPYRSPPCIAGSMRPFPLPALQETHVSKSGLMY